MILLLVGLLFISTPLYISSTGYHWTNNYSEVYSTHNKTLTEESPVFRYNVTSASSMVGISSLHSNNTPVTLVVRGPAHVQFNVTNVTSLEGCHIVVGTGVSDSWVEVMRQGLDANITITVFYETIITATTAPLPPAFNPTAVWGWILSVYALLLLVFTTARSRVPHRVRFGLVIAFVLVLVGTSCCYPLVRGNIQHDFDPVYTLVNPPDEQFSFPLNETHPSSSLNLSSLLSGDGIVVKCHVHSITSSSYPIILAVSNEDSFTLVLEEECQDGGWWFSIPVTTNPSMLFNFTRANSDAEVALRVGITYRTLLPRQDITLPADLCAIGIVVMVLGVGVTVMVDRYSSSGSGSSKDRPPDIE